MKKFLYHFLALGITAASLSSCSRANYAFNPKAPAYLGSERVASAPRPAQTQLQAPVASPEAKPAVPTATVPQTAIVATATPAARQARPSLVQRVLIKKVAKQLAKVQSIRQNTANVEHTASKTGRAAIVTLAGLLLIVLGAAIGNGLGGLLVLIGIIAFLVGLILIVVHLVSGD